MARTSTPEVRLEITITAIRAAKIHSLAAWSGANGSVWKDLYTKGQVNALKMHINVNIAVKIFSGKKTNICIKK
jgi:hypothetical protein